MHIKKKNYGVRLRVTKIEKIVQTFMLHVQKMKNQALEYLNNLIRKTN